jgi:hypothetical protein
MKSSTNSVRCNRVQMVEHRTSTTPVKVTHYLVSEFETIMRSAETCDRCRCAYLPPLTVVAQPEFDRSACQPRAKSRISGG